MEPRNTRLYGAVDAPDTMVDAVGEAAPPLTGTLNGRYVVGEAIGRGGMGEVLSARDEQVGRSVAIKRLRVANPSTEILARFLREARIQGRLEHPAIVPVHEVTRDEHGQPFFVMKQLAGTTLADVLSKGEMARPQLLRAFVDACLAIEFAHTRGVIHRDLKPANIVLGDFGEVYVLDWGIAKVAGEADASRSFTDIDTWSGSRGLGSSDPLAYGDGATAAGAILGTPGYISPEQIRNDADLDARADVYALGCILYELLAHYPLHPRGQAALASAIGGVDARASLRAETPPELDAICVRATAVEREGRFATARALGDAVQTYLDGDRDEARRRALAEGEMEAAQTALRTGERRDAIRSAARALALDPTAREAADLVGRLMLEPPKVMPKEVEAELHELDDVALRISARFGMFAAFAYLVFLPILYWVGFRELWYHAVGAGISVVIIYAEARIAPRDAYLSGYIAITGNLMIFALFSWMVTPQILGPGPGLIIVMLMAPHRKLVRTWLLAALTALAILGPWLISAMADAVGSDIVLHTRAAELHQLPTQIALAIYLVSLIALAAVLGSMQEGDRRMARRAIQLQSWQLRQLMPG